MQMLSAEVPMSRCLGLVGLGLGLGLSIRVSIRSSIRHLPMQWEKTAEGKQTIT